MRSSKGALVAVLLSLTANAATAAQDWLSYELGSVDEVKDRYPDESWLPETYGKHYRDLSDTIRLFTRQSLKREGIDKTSVRVTIHDDDQVHVAIKPVNDTTRAFKDRHQTFIDDQHAGQARVGVEACKSDDHCWQGYSQDPPWAMFLPLGLPMVNQQAVMLLDYPPADSLTQQDYLDNFTMCRWSQVLGSAGIDNPLRYESIIDARPIAAKGSGKVGLPDADRYFDSQNGTGGNYIQPMLELLTDPAEGKGANAARPLGVFGSPARDAWASITGQASVDVLETGTTKLPGGQEVPWIGTNHPDVTTYKSCSTDNSDDAGGLVRSESKDLTAACWLKHMAQNRDADPDRVRRRCQKRWFSPRDESRKHRLCVRAKLDTSHDDARCGSYEQARRYCHQHDNKPCATDSCQIKDGGGDAVASIEADQGDWRRICHYED